jgi:hypothetical protein
VHDRQDIRKHKLEPQVITIHVVIEVVTEHEVKGFLPMLSDDLATMLGERLENTQGMIHLRTQEWDVSMQ